jgi:DNA polymerase-3 subunit epsilon
MFAYDFRVPEERKAVVDMRSLPVRSVSVAVLDLEMTGLDPLVDRVCEVALVRAEGSAVVEEFQSLVRPGVRMSAGAVRVHGLRDQDLVDAPAFEEVSERVRSVLEGALLIGHHVTHDLEFLQAEFDRAPQPLAPPLYVDTLLIARRLFAFPKNNLASVCSGLGISVGSLHRALHDARATLAVWQRMVEILDPDGTLTVGELIDLVGALAPNSPRRLHQQRLLAEAFRAGRTVIIDYASHEAMPIGAARREIGIWRMKPPYVQAWCFLRQGERVFRFDRIRAVEEGSREYEAPRQFVARV